MINILVDEGYAFDYLSILEIKMDKFKQIDAFKQCYNYLMTQTKQELFFDIMNSIEYNNLKTANLKTFEAVDKARYGEITAKEVDDYNMERYRAKIALQKKFFNTYVAEYKN